MMILMKDEKRIDKKEALNMINDIYEDFKEFIRDYSPCYIVVKEKENKIVFDELDFKGRQFMILVPMDNDNAVNDNIVFRDDLTDYQQIYESDRNIDVEEWENELKILKNNISELGCELRGAGIGGNDNYLWYDLVIPMNDFTIEKLSKCTELWNDYNDRLNKFIK